MTTTENTPKPFLEILDPILERGCKFSSRPNLEYGALQLWSTQVRAQMAKIYGKDSKHLAHFLPIQRNLTQQEINDEMKKRLAHLHRFAVELAGLPEATKEPLRGKRVFIGHGRSPLWRELKDFINDRLHLPWDEFNREATAGHTTTARLKAMMADAAFAFLVMTAEEERSDATLHARPNVIHEVGLFQGHLGIERAIILLEEGCSEFSNIIGLSQIRFPKNDIAARFEEIRRVLEREGII
jgi:predicted nucleotide-binding protein